MSGFPKKHWDWRKYYGEDEINKTIDQLKHITLNGSMRNDQDELIDENKSCKVVLIRHGEPDYSIVDENQVINLDKNYIYLKDDVVNFMHLGMT